MSFVTWRYHPSLGATIAESVDRARIATAGHDLALPSITSTALDAPLDLAFSKGEAVTAGR